MPSGSLPMGRMVCRTIHNPTGTGRYGKSIGQGERSDRKAERRSTVVRIIAERPVLVFAAERVRALRLRRNPPPSRAMPCLWRGPPSPGWMVVRDADGPPSSWTLVLDDIACCQKLPRE